MHSCVTFCIIVFVLCEISNEKVSCQDLPKLMPFSFPPNLTVGSKVNVFCSAYAGSHPLHFSFLKDEQELKSIEIQHFAESAVSFTLDPLSLGHTGNYSCIVKNAVGLDKSTAPLIVTAPPRWIIEPSSVNVKKGESATLECTAFGSPAVQITWKKRLDSSELVPVSSRNVKILTNSTLIVSKAKKSNGGVYVCEASNGIGNKLTKEANIVVYEYPSVQRIVDHVTVERGKTAELSCVASGDAPLSLLWTKDRKLLNEWPEVLDRISFSEHPSSDNVKFSLSVSNTELDDEGIYTCVAKNEFGSDEQDVRLMLVERPQSPQYIEVVDIWSRSARLKWAVPKNGNSAILSYTVEYWTTLGRGHWNETFPSSSTSCILRNLTPFTLYHFHIWASNSIGDSLPSSEVKFTTAKEEPSAPPVDVRIEEVGSTFLRISWKPPPRENWNGAITGYYVGYKQSSSKLPFTYNTVEAEDDLIYYVLRGLRRATRYLISVRAFNDIGSGPQSEELSFKTHNQEPPPQPILMVKDIGSTYVQINWLLFNDAKSQTTGYAINYRKSGGKWQEISIPDAAQTTYTLTNLDSSVPYQVFVTSLGTTGISEPSEIATIRTSAEAIYDSPHQLATTAPAQTVMDDMTQILYIVVPVAVATVIIVTVIVGACVYVYSKRPIPTCHPYGDLPASKNFSYMATAPRRRDPPVAICGGNPMLQGSPYSTVPLTRPEHDDDEPIYESVMDEIRNKIKQRSFEEEMKNSPGTIV